MRALTVQQPWAWAIIHGGKTIENRTQPWRYRGPLVIHAGKRIDRPAVASEAINGAWFDKYGWRPASDGLFQTGIVLGVVDLVDVHPAAVGQETCCQPWGQWTANTVHLVLENPRSLGYLPDPIEAKGRLGLWQDADLFAEVRSQLRGAA